MATQTKLLDPQFVMPDLVIGMGWPSEGLEPEPLSDQLSGRDRDRFRLFFKNQGAYPETPPNAVIALQATKRFFAERGAIVGSDMQLPNMARFEATGLTVGTETMTASVVLAANQLIVELR